MQRGKHEACVRGKHVSSGKGRRLLKKGRRGLLRALFSRAGMIALLILLQIGIVVLLFSFLRDYLPHFVTLNAVFSTLIGVYLLNSPGDNSSKITWLLVIILVPTFGALLYAYTRSDLGHRLLKRESVAGIERSRGLLAQDEQAMEQMRAEAPFAEGLYRYVNRTGCFPVYRNCSARYFPLGDEMFPAILEELEKAERFIFLEFFIIAEGEMWQAVLDVLTRKAAAGVDVRVMYDGNCEFFTLPRSYPRELETRGIQCRVFAPVTPFVSTYYNYRDHRKILVIDGNTVFTGGVNLADEYINRVRRFGHWKDTGLLLRGEAAESFTLMFLQNWSLFGRVKEERIEIPAGLPLPPQSEKGLVLPYGDCPMDDERVGELVYIDMLNRARRYVHIMTPYLILDGEMEMAIRFAAERGVDVTLILPGIPDKKLPYALAKTHFAALLSSGVKISLYKPGFVHAKVFVCDDREAVVGTINLDYRSLYHHFECAAYLAGTDCIADIERDFQQTLGKCVPVSEQTIKEEKWGERLSGAIFKWISPLL